MEGTGSGVHDFVQAGKHGGEHIMDKASDYKDDVHGKLAGISVEADKRLVMAGEEANKAVVGIAGTIEDELIGLMASAEDFTKKTVEPVREFEEKLRSDVKEADVLDFVQPDASFDAINVSHKLEERLFADDSGPNVDSSMKFHPGLIDESASENLLESFSVPSKVEEMVADAASLPEKASQLFDDSIAAFEAQLSGPGRYTSTGNQDFNEHDDLLVDSSAVSAPKKIEDEGAFEDEYTASTYENQLANLDLVRPVASALEKEFSLPVRSSPSPPRQPTPPLRELTPPPREPTLPPREPTPPPREPTPPPREPTPPPREPTPPPREPTPPLREPTPPPREPTPPPREPTPPPREPTPPPRMPTPPPRQPTPPLRETTPPPKKCGLQFAPPVQASAPSKSEAVVKKSSHSVYDSVKNPLAGFNPRESDPP
jgi:hypothetical protein